MENKECNYEDKSISYKIEGAGVAVVFVHGFGEDSAIWRNQEGKFNEFCCLYIDLPGSGASEFNKELSGIPDYAKAINAVLQKENIDSCIFIGHSMGGYIALSFAELFPEKLIALALFHSSAYADNEEKVANRRKSIDFVKANGATAYFKTMLPDLFFDKIKSSTLIQEQVQYAKKISDAAVAQYLQAMIDRKDKTSILRNLSIPFGLILGENDKAVPFAQGLEQTNLAAVTYVYILRHSAHMGMLEESDRVNEVLGEFLISCTS